MPAKTVEQITKAILHTAQTSHYNVYIGLPVKNEGSEEIAFVDYLKNNGIAWGKVQENIQLACSEASLPGSSFLTHELNSDYTGVTEKHVYRRNYDGLIDLTFYVVADMSSPYSVIRLFESWMRFIGNESTEGENSTRNRNHFYGAKYPDDYYGTLRVNKFERNYKTNLNYEFLGAYPINITSMPLSYESPNVLKCVVQFSYIRYNINQVPGVKGETSTPERQNLTAGIQDLSYSNGVALDVWTAENGKLISEWGQPYQKEMVDLFKNSQYNTNGMSVSGLNSQQTLDELYEAGRSGRIKSASEFIGPLQ